MSCAAKTVNGARCPKAGRWELILVLSARNGARLMAALPMAVCEEHKREATVAGYLTEQDWLRIVGSFLEKGLVMPEMWRATLGFRKIQEQEGGLV